MKDRVKTPPAWTAVVVLIAATPFALAVTALAGLLIALLASPAVRAGQRVGLVYGMATVAALYLGLIFGAALIVRASRMRRITAPAMALAALCSVAAIILWSALFLWTEHWSGRTDDYVVCLALSLTLITVALLHNGIFTCLEVRDRGYALAAFAVALSVWGAVLPLVYSLMWLLLYDDDMPLETIAPYANIFGVFVLLATALLPALIRRSNAKAAARESVSLTAEIAMECPMCGEPQRLRTGTHLCRACGLLMHIELEEQRCECGYLLYRLQSPTCPECGRELPENAYAPPEVPPAPE